MPKCMYMYMCGMMMMALDTKAVQVERYTVTVTVAIAHCRRMSWWGVGGYMCAIDLSPECTMLTNRNNISFKAYSV